jgi:hypothetical protein
MNTKNLLIASLIGAVVTTALANIPFVNLLNCLLCLPFWGGPLLAAWFYKRQTGTMTMNHAISVGALAGLFAGILGFLLSFVGMAGASGLANQIGQYLPSDSIPPDILTGPASFLFTCAGVLTNIVFGVIGGLIAGAIFKQKSPTTGS